MEYCGKIAILAGGLSGEREISLKSGKAVYDALRDRNLDVSLVDIGANFASNVSQYKGTVAFLALHGEFGEDGRIQALLEEAGIPYTGSGVKASQLAMDKAESRKLFIKNGLLVPPHKIITKKTDEKSITRGLSMPLVIKPKSAGSSLGLSIVKSASELTKALREAFRYGDIAIAEKYIHGREFTVGILDGRALPVIEIYTRANVYDYDAKYKDESTRYILPVTLDERYYSAMQKIAVKAHNILECRDFSRVDMRMDNYGNIYILEVNTIPGMTERSLLPKAARASGMGFADLCTKLIELAYERKEPEAWQEVGPKEKLVSRKPRAKKQRR
jgi:D-alanine-D-alanine ligase